jgi:hypothetical protein
MILEMYYDDQMNLVWLNHFAILNKMICLLNKFICSFLTCVTFVPMVWNFQLIIAVPLQEQHCYVQEGVA